MLSLIIAFVFTGAFFVLLVLGIRYFLDRNNVDQIIEKNKEINSVFIKKYNEANLEFYRGVFLRVGFVVSLGIALLAFTWTTYDRGTANLGNLAIPDDIEIEPPQTKQEKPPPPPPPPPKLEIVEDEEEIEEPEIKDMDVDEETAIEAIIEDEEIDEDEIFLIVEDSPEFPGGDAALLKYLANTRYPPIARENGIEGTVWVKFVVDKSGTVTNVSILRGVDPLLDQAAISRVKSMPAWAPGRQRGKPVRVQFQVKIGFRLT